MNVYDHIRNIQEQAERIESRVCGTTAQQHAFNLVIDEKKIEEMSAELDRLVNDIDVEAFA